MSLVRGEFVQADGLTLVLWQTAATIFVKQRSNEVRLGVFSVCCQPEKPSRLAIVFGQIASIKRIKLSGTRWRYVLT
jgi:hypothetical protein